MARRLLAVLALAAVFAEEPDQSPEPAAAEAPAVPGPEDADYKPSFEQQEDIVKEIKCDVCRVGVKVFWSDMDKVDNPSQSDKEAMARRFCNHPTGAMMNPYTTHEVAWANGNWTFKRKVVEDSEYAGQLTWRQDVILRACAQIAGNVAPQVFDTLVKAFDTPKHQATRKGLTKQVCRELTRACKNRQLKAAHQEL